VQTVDTTHATITASGPPMKVDVRYASADPSFVRECFILVLSNGHGVALRAG
jgi:hypothetical protein